jgi:hypothetical protein
MLTRSSRHLAAPVLLSLLALSACNALTGVDDLVIRDGEGTTSGDGAGSGGLPISGVSGAGGLVGVGGAGGGPVLGTADASSSTGVVVPPDPLVGAQGVTLADVAVYQGVKRPLVVNSALASSDIPIVAGKDALVRVFAHTDGSYDGQPVTARLHLGNGAAIEITQPVNGSPTDDSLGTTLNFQVPGAAITAGEDFRVELLQLDKGSGDHAAARFPASGTAPLGAKSSGAGLSIVLVPLAYGADGSNRVPDTSAAQVQAYRDMMFAIYPTPQIEITVHAPVAWGKAVSPDGTGWGELLDGMAGLRQQENPANDAYYYGIFNPSDSVFSFCGSGCTAGLGYVAGAGDASFRAAIGLGWKEVSEGTMAHEIGHNHGRNHAPCGTSGDPSYPHPDAQLGVWGYDLVNGTLFAPDTTKDLMSYCGPSWVSDYTFEALFDRLAQVNNASVIYPQNALDRSYERARVNVDGSLSWLPPATLHTPPLSSPTQVSLSSAAGTTTTIAHYVAYDHLPGGVLVWPAPAAATTAMALNLDGKALSLTR